MMKKLVFFLLLPILVYSQTIVTKTIKASGGDYTTIANWEADTDNDLVSANQVQIGVLDASESYAGGWTITGATTSATCYRMLTVADGHKHDGYLHSGAYVLMTSSTANTIGENHFKISWLEIDGNNTGNNCLRIYNSDSVFIDHCLLHNSAQFGILIDNASRNINDQYWLTSSFMWDCAYGAVYIRSGGIHIRHISVYNSGDNDATYGAIVNDNLGSIGLLNSIIHNSNASSTGNCCHLREDEDPGTGWRDDTGWNVTNDDTAPGADPQINVTITDYFKNAASDSFHLKNTAAAINTGQFWKYVFPGYGDIARTDIDGETIPTEGGLYKTDEFQVDRGADENTNVSNSTVYDEKYVKPSGSSYWSGMDGGDVFTSIQDALDDVDAYGAVYVAQGRYFENITIPEDVRLYGGFDGDEADPDHTQRGTNYNFMYKSIIDGSSDSSRVVDMEDNSIIDGFKVVNGKTLFGSSTGSGAGINAEGNINYVNIRNCAVESCRTAADKEFGSVDCAAQGGAILVDSNAGAGTCVIEKCIAFACSSYCGAIEVREGSLAAARFLNCIAYNNAAFGFEISVNATDDPPRNTNHVIQNCIGIRNRNPRDINGELGVIDSVGGTACNWNSNFWSWAKDSAYTKYCFTTGAKWGDAYDKPVSGGFWSPAASSIIFDIDAGVGVSFNDTVTVSGTSRTNNFNLRGDSQCRKTGAGGDLPLYMGPFIPIIARILTSQ